MDSLSGLKPSCMSPQYETVWRMCLCRFRCDCSSPVLVNWNQRTILHLLAPFMFSAFPNTWCNKIKTLKYYHLCKTGNSAAGLQIAISQNKQIVNLLFLVMLVKDQFWVGSRENLSLFFFRLYHEIFHIHLDFRLMTHLKASNSDSAVFPQYHNDVSA